MVEDITEFVKEKMSLEDFGINDRLDELQMAKKRNHKIMITDEAQEAADYFLKNCYNIGIKYENR